MSSDQPDLSREEEHPPFNLERETYGYIVLSAGIAAMFVTLYYFPQSVPYWRVTRLLPVLGIAVITHFAYQYTVTTWYEKFDSTPSVSGGSEPGNE